MNKIYLILIFFCNLCSEAYAQPAIKSKELLKNTEKALQNIKTLTYKISHTEKYFSSNDTIKSSAIGNLYLNLDDEIGAYHKIYFKHDDKKYSYHKYDGKYTLTLFYDIDSINHLKKINLQNITQDNYNTVKGTFISNYLLQNYLKKQNIFKQYRSILAKFFLKDITTEESVYKGIPVYVLTVYGKDKPRENRINSSVEKYYIRKVDFLPIAHSFYGEFQGMKQTEFTEIEYLEINPEISLDTFKIDPSVKEVDPKVYFEEIKKYNL